MNQKQKQSVMQEILFLQYRTPVTNYKMAIFITIEKLLC